MRDSIIKIVRRQTDINKRIFRLYLTLVSIAITVFFIWGLTGGKKEINYDRVIKDYQKQDIREYLESADGICGLDINQYRIDLNQIYEENGEYIYKYPDGKIARLTLRKEVQDILKKRLGMYRIPFSAAVVMEAPTGRILGMYEDGELKNKYSMNMTFKAASVFKIITMETLLSEKKIDTNATMCYFGGKRRLTRRHLIENPGKDNRCLVVDRALGHSANVIFARLAYKYLDREILSNHTSLFGFFESIPVEFEVEKSRIEIPDSREELAYTAAGFGETYISPLHGAIISSIVANDGIYVKPTIIDRIEDENENVLYESSKGEIREVFTRQVAASLKEMMRYTVTEGTAHKFFARRRPVDFIKDIKVAGKTGSIADRNGSYTEYNWFVGFAPLDDPKYVISVLTVNSEDISARATLYARYILDDLFKTNSLVVKKSPSSHRKRLLGIK